MAIAAGNWVSVRELGPNQAVGAVSNTAMEAVGAVIVCRDMGPTNYGEAEFIYMRGVANTAVGNVVVYKTDGSTVRPVLRARGAIAVAMATMAANQWGWYQRTGLARVTGAAGITAGTTLYLTSTAGVLSSTVSAGDLVYGARSASATDTPFVLAVLSRPYVADTDNL